MNKKIFSALLMGAFALTSVSTLYSCKDYDDDINGLKTDQADLLSKLEALQSDVDTKYSDLNGQLATAADNATKALAGVQDLESLVNEVKTSSEAAGKAAAAAQTTADDALGAAEAAQTAADAAQKTADEALAAAQKALAAVGSDESGKTALQQIADLSKRVGELETLKEGIPVLQEKVEKQSEDMATLKKQVDKYEEYFNSLFTMVTSVELFGTYYGEDVVTAQSLTNEGILLSMIHGNVGMDSQFGDNESLDFQDNKTVNTTATPLEVFTKGADIKVNQGVILRVNPINAVLSADGVKVMNSKGEDMSAYIHVASVEPYEEYIVKSRSAASSKSGLWKVNFEWNDGVDVDAFKKAATTTVNGKDMDILYAVAVSNTKSSAVDSIAGDRYVASTYDLVLGAKVYKPAKTLNYTVDNVKVGDLKNRWSEDDEGTAKSGEETEPLDKPYTDAVEHTWATSTDNYPTPYPSMILGEDDAHSNAKKDMNDCRVKNEYLPATVGTPFTVKLTGDTYGVDDPSSIQYYYVTLDYNFAGVSVPSEINAWKGYDISGLNTMTDASKSREITINDLKANAKKGDKIGFRVFAVNYDGTLVDPDGRAFYVVVGNDAVVDEVSGTITPNAQQTASYTSDYIALNKTFQSLEIPASGYSTTTFKEGSDHTESGARLAYTLYKDKNGTLAEDWKDAKYVKVTMNDPKLFLDGGTFSYTIVAKDNSDGSTREVNTLTVSIKKVMPGAKEISYKSGQVVNGVYTCYLNPQNDWDAEGDNGYMLLTNVVNGLDDYYTFTFADAAKDGNKVIDNEVTKNTAYKLTVDNEFVNNETKHKTTISYNYGNISCVAKDDGTYETTKDWIVDSDPIETVFACAVDPSVMSYSWNQKNIGTTKNPVMADVNFIYYTSEVGKTMKAGEGVLGKKDGDVDETLLDYLKAVSAYDNNRFTSDGLWKVGNYVNVKAELLSKENNKSEYFSVAYNGVGGFTFTSLSSTSTPIADVPSILKLTATDAFGHKNIIKLPFTVKVNKGE